MAKIIIRRTKAALQDRARKYVVLLDGEEIGEVSNGSGVEFNVEPGKHTVQMKIDWCRSRKFDVNAAIGESVILECGPNAMPLLELLYITLWRNKYIWLRSFN